MSTNHAFTDQERADFSPEELRRLAHKYPNRRHPFCGWCHVPHRPVERESDCEAAERELDAEDYAAIDRRLQEVLRLLDYDSIRAEVQGELWHFLTDPGVGGHLPFAGDAGVDGPAGEDPAGRDDRAGDGGADRGGVEEGEGMTLTRDRLLADLSRAVAECFPDRAEAIMREVERRMPSGAIVPAHVVQRYRAAGHTGDEFIVFVSDEALREAKPEGVPFVFAVQPPPVARNVTLTVEEIDLSPLLHITDHDAE